MGLCPISCSMGTPHFPDAPSALRPVVLMLWCVYNQATKSPLGWDSAFKSFK